MSTLLVTKRLHVECRISQPTNVASETAMCTVKPISKISNSQYENKLKTNTGKDEIECPCPWDDSYQGKLCLSCALPWFSHLIISRRARPASSIFSWQKMEFRVTFRTQFQDPLECSISATCKLHVELRTVVVTSVPIVSANSPPCLSPPLMNTAAQFCTKIILLFLSG